MKDIKQLLKIIVISIVFFGFAIYFAEKHGIKEKDEISVSK